MTESHSTIGKYYTILVLCFTTLRLNRSSIYYAPCIAHPCFILSTLPPRLQSEWSIPACLAASAMGMFPLKSSDPTLTFIKQNPPHKFFSPPYLFNGYCLVKKTTVRSSKKDFFCASYATSLSKQVLGVAACRNSPQVSA